MNETNPCVFIFNKSPDEGELDLPVDWKFGLVSALHKKGDRKDPNNEAVQCLHRCPLRKGRLSNFKASLSRATLKI